MGHKERDVVADDDESFSIVINDQIGAAATYYATLYRVV